MPEMPPAASLAWRLAALVSSYLFPVACASLVFAVIAEWISPNWILGRTRFERRIFLSKRRRSTTSSKRRAVIVTGCDNDGGFGRHIVTKLIDYGFVVFACCLTDEGVSDCEVKLMPARCAEKSRSVIPVRLNICKQGEVDACVETVQRECKARGLELWAIVNNAGIQAGALIDWTSSECFALVMDINYMGAVRMCKAFLPLLKQARGRVVNLTSIDGLRALPGVAAYTASKHALEAFTDSLRYEMTPFGVAVVAVNPGTYLTPMAHTAVDRLVSVWNNLSEDVKTEYGHSFLENMCKFAQQFIKNCNKHPEEVGDAALSAVASINPARRYLVGPDARYLWWNLYRFVPEWVFDWIIPKVVAATMGLPAKLTPAAGQS